MKTCLLFLFSLCAWLAQAQDIRRVYIAPPGSSQAYEVRAVRNLSTYPLTTAGTSSFTAAVASGAFALTVAQNGCVIAKGQLPPATMPTCTVTPSIPSWITGLQWKHDGTTLTVQASGDVATIAFGTSPATTFTASNPDGVQIQSGTDYGYGTVSNGSYTRQWQINKATTTFVLLLKNSSGASYSQTFTATTSTSFVALIGTAVNPTGPPPTSTTPSWIAGLRYSFEGSSHLLSIQAAGSTGTLAFHPVTGGGFPTTNPDNVPINADTDYGYGTIAQGSYTKQWQLYYTGTSLQLLLKDAASSGTFTTTLTPVTGASNIDIVAGTTTTNPPTSTTTSPGSGTLAAGTYDADGFLVYDDQGWSGADEKQIENGEMLLKFKKSVGACATWASLKSDGINLINDEQVGPSGAKFSDKGVQWQFSTYSTPIAVFSPYVIGGHGEMGTGANPVQGGSTAPYFGVSPVLKSAIINDPTRGPVFCAWVRGLIWNFAYEPGHIVVQFEYWLLPNQTIGYKVRSVVEDRGSRVPEQRTWQALSQELPCLYNIGDLNVHLAKLNGQELNLRAGVPLDAQGPDYFTDECWSGTYTPDRSKGVTLYTPENAIMKSWQKHDEQGQWMDKPSGYINASQKRNLDIPGSYLDHGYIILGGYQYAQNRLATLEPIPQAFDFDFSKSDNKWWNEDSRVQRDPGTGLIKWFLGDEKVDGGTFNYGRFTSPVRAWKANQLRRIEFTMAVSGTNRLMLKYGRPGQFDSVNSAVEVAVTGDGVERTYTFDVPWAADNSLISYVGLTAITPTNSSAYAIIRRIRKVQ